MSYDIFYNKQFIRLRKTGEVIAVFLSGSSNCFDIGQNGRDGRRSRDWSSMTFYNRPGKLSEKPDVILKNVDAYLQKTIRNQKKWQKEYKEGKVNEKDIIDRYGYYASMAVGGGSCSDTSFSRWRAQFANGIKEAMTIEELIAKGIHPYFRCYPYSAPDQPSSGILSEKQYFELVNSWKEWKAKTPNSYVGIGFSPSDTDRVLDLLRAGKPKPTPAAKVQVQTDHFFVLENPLGYYIKSTPRGYRYSHQPNYSAKKFMSEAEAEKCRAELVAKKRHQAETWKVKRVDAPANFLVPEGKNRRLDEQTTAS